MKLRWDRFLLLTCVSLSFTGCQGVEPEQRKDLASIETVKTETPPDVEPEVDHSLASKSAAEQERIRILIEQEHNRALAKMNSIPPPGDDPYRWIQDAQDVYGEYAPPSTIFKVTDEGNCGGPGGGCTVQLSDLTGPLEPVEIYISPTAIGSVHLLFHEIAHSNGVLDECMAEKWAHTVTGLIQWSYDECDPK